MPPLRSFGTNPSHPTHAREQRWRKRHLAKVTAMCHVSRQMKSCCCVYKHANRQALVHACFRKMEIPTEVWADAIEVRGIALWVAGFDRPWDVTIGTLSSVSAMHAVFGDDLRRTVTMRVDVEILLDVKRLDSTTAHARGRDRRRVY